MRCEACQTRYFDVSVSGDDLGRLYADYRGEAYFQQRRRFEPWYTRAMNDGIGGEAEMRQRRAVLADALTECGIANDFGAILDHGGDRGQMLLDLRAPLRAVYEISGVVTEPGVVAIDQAAMTAQKWDLILSCHVLEHLPEPKAYIDELVALGHAGTVYFFEVPDEKFKSFGFNASSAQKNWISRLAGQPTLFKLFDFLSTALRIKLRLVPPLLFVALREHLTFFSTEGLTRILEDGGLSVLSVKPRATGHIGVVAVKPGAASQG